jgi:HNH endonuclease
MRCIFCKSNSTKSRSIEHIIPESLGNIEHVLPRGAICDTCNNYFARKVEGPLLETLWFRHARSRQWVPNKRGLIPPMAGLVPGARMPAHVWLDGPRLTLGGRNEEQHALTEAILTGRASSVYVPIVEAIDQRLMSRFLAKVALEVLAHRIMHVEGWNEEVVDMQALDPLRHFARVGDRPDKWPFSRRSIYREEDVQEEGGAGYQVLHEFTILCEPLPEPGHLDLYAIVCFFGEEFAINLGEPEIASYERWLKAHGGTSPLYVSDELPARPS